jgi:predicted lipoprotein with Yx(FWY)xxD motif
MSRTVTFLTAAMLVAGLPLAAHAEDYAAGAIKTMKTAKGEVLTDAKGMTLYVFDKDAKDRSNCYDDCAKKWPPLKADASAKMAGKFGLVARKDGTKQWAHAGKPLYLWQGDKKPGDTTGDGVGGAWHTATE